MRTKPRFLLGFRGVWLMLIASGNTFPPPNFCVSNFSQYHPAALHMVPICRAKSLPAYLLLCLRSANTFDRNIPLPNVVAVAVAVPLNSVLFCCSQYFSRHTFLYHLLLKEPKLQPLKGCLCNNLISLGTSLHFSYYHLICPFLKDTPYGSPISFYNIHFVTKAL